MVFQLVALAFATIIVYSANALEDLPVPGPKERFKINMVTIDGTPNEYFSYTKINPLPDGYSSATEAHIVKQLPEDLTLIVELKYQGQDIPPFEFPVCPGMKDPIFVRDVISVGKPKETFPHECPILPGNYTVDPWSFPHYKIPPGTVPGPVVVNVNLKSPTEGSIFHLYSEGEVILDTSELPAVPKMPLGK